MTEIAFYTNKYCKINGTGQLQVLCENKETYK